MARRVLSSVSLKMEISRGLRRAKRGCRMLPVVTDRGMTSWWLGEDGSDWARGLKGGGGSTGQVILLTSFTSWPSDGVLTNTARSGDDGGKVGRRTAQGTSLWGLGTVLERLNAGEARGGANDTEGFGLSGAS